MEWPKKRIISSTFIIRKRNEKNKRITKVTRRNVEKTKKRRIRERRIKKERAKTSIRVTKSINIKWTSRLFWKVRSWIQLSQK